jgi:hypothetical protein
MRFTRRPYTPEEQRAIGRGELFPPERTCVHCGLRLEDHLAGSRNIVWCPPRPDPAHESTGAPTQV